MNYLDTYRLLKEKHKDYELACALIIYNAVDCYVSHPTIEEYQVICNKVYDVFLHTEDYSLEEIAYGVAEKYSKKEVTLNEIKIMSKRSILEMARIN